MFYKELILKLKSNSDKKISYINELMNKKENFLINKINDNDKNCKNHWENQKKEINEIKATLDMLIKAFNDQRLIIGKIIERIENEKKRTSNQKNNRLRNSNRKNEAKK